MTRFRKMHGLGNDFVILDAREGAVAMDSARARAIADRRTGVGCDQVILLEPSEVADVRMRIWNADGGEVEACGNATRCVVMLGAGTIETKGGILKGDADGVDMGAPRFGWEEIPLAYAMDTAAMPVGWEELQEPSAVNVGNPHVVFFVEDADAVDLARLGPLIENDPLFPERVNVNVASFEGDAIRLRVWERGAGLTQACGTGACATAVAAIRGRQLEGPVEVRLPGGSLTIDWQPGGTIRMSGPATHVFDGELVCMSVEVITLGCRLNMAESEAMRALAAARGRSRHRQQLRGHQRGGAPDPPGDPQGEAGAARGAGDRHRLRGAGRAGDVRGDAGGERGCSAIGRSSISAAFLPEAEKVRVSDIMAVRETAPHLVTGFAERARAFVEVQNGCDHRCTFCIIPYGRGNSRSVPAGLVVERIKALVGRGLPRGRADRRRRHQLRPRSARRADARGS